MARRKIRKHDSVLIVKSKINNWIEKHDNEIIKNMLDKTGYDSIEQLREDEYHGRFGLDCGWVWLCTKNEEQYHEWFLDNNKYPDYVSGIDYPYNSQSTTLKEIQCRYILKEMDLEDKYFPYVRLD